MSEVDQMSFEREIAAAHEEHQQAIRAATSAFDAACHAAQAKWRERVARAKVALDTVPSAPDPAEGNTLAAAR